MSSTFAEPDVDIESLRALRRAIAARRGPVARDVRPDSQARFGVDLSAVPAQGNAVAAPVNGAGSAGQEGTAEIVDTVTDYRANGGRYSAVMQRDQYRTPAEAAAARQGTTKPPAMHTGLARIELDTSVPQITLPWRLAVRAAVEADFPRGLAPTSRRATAITPAEVKATGDRFVAVLQQRLNGWFSLDVPACPGLGWTGRSLPIRVVISQVSSGPADATVAVSPHTGRSSVSGDGGLVVLHSGDLDDDVLAHEGTHLVLGHPDEYRETDPALRAAHPLQKSDERVKNDFPLSGNQDDWGRWAQLQQRHFSFVQVFVQDVLTRLGHPECHPALRELQRPTQIIVRPSLQFGGTDYGASMFVALGLDLGIPLRRQRDWAAFLGVHGRLLIGTDYPNRDAFMLGARLGFEHRWNPSGLSPGVNLFGEAGGTAETGTGGRGVAPYAAAGARIDVSTWASGATWQLGVEAMRGARIDAEHRQFFMLGLSAAVGF